MKRNIVFLLVLLLLAGLPPVSWGYLNLAQAQNLRQNSPARASSHYKTAARLLFWESGLHEKAGLAALESWDIEQAYSLLLDAQKQETLSPEGWLALGEIFILNGDFESAYAQAWLPLYQTGYASPAILTRLAEYAAYKQDSRLEILYRTRLLELDSENAFAHFRLGILLAVDSPESALANLQQANRPDSDPLLQSLQQAVAQDDPAYRYILIGRALANLGEWPLALDGFRAAAEENPGYAESWAWQAEAMYQLAKDPSLVELYYEKALALNPNAAGIQAMAGLYRERNRNYPQAEAHYLQAIALEPRNPAWRIALAGVVARRDLPAALEHYQAATQLAPHDVSTWMSLASFSVQYEAFLEDAGLDAALRAYALEPENFEVLALLGRVLTAVKEVETAQIMYEKAIAFAPNLPAPRFHLALLHLQTGKRVEARQVFEDVIRLDPGGPYSQQAQAILARYFP